MKKENLIVEIQELFQWIKINYQEGVDYKHITWDKLHEAGVGITNILSPRLKKYCREKFGFLLGVNDYLDYFKNDTNGSAVLYRTNRTTKLEQEKGEDILWWCKERLDTQKLDQNPKKCSVCQKKTFKNDGRMKLWDDECRDIGVNEDGWSRKVSRPSPLAYFHPECGKKYFADEGPLSENNIRIKEKLLRNLDKISLDPIGYLADAEIVKSNEVEVNYQGGGGNDPVWKAWNDKVHKIKIEGEEINLITLAWEVKLAVRKAIIQEIKQNPQDWKIENSNIYITGISNGITIPDSFKILKHKSGRRHWNVGIIHLNESLEKGKQEWAEIEALIKGSKLPIGNRNKINDIELEKIKKIFQEHHINKIIFENGKLSIKYDNNQNVINDSEKQALEKYCQEHNEKEINLQKLGISSESTSPSPSNLSLVLFGGILLIAVLVATIIGLVVKNKAKRK